MKTLALDDIHADPYQLDALLEAGERIEITRSGQPIAQVIPHPAAAPKLMPKERPDFRARLIEMWGPDALKSTEPVSELMDLIRAERRF